MVASIATLASCIGVGAPFSVLGDFFGFARAQLAPDPTGVTVQVSLLHQAQRLEGDHFHLNVIAVGSDQFTDGDYQEIDYSIYKPATFTTRSHLGSAESNTGSSPRPTRTGSTCQRQRTTSSN
jgi:hypothetical protein